MANPLPRRRLTNNPPPLEIVYRSDSQLHEDARNPRIHSAEQIEKIRASIVQFGFTNPLLIDENHKLIAGHARLAAARAAGLTEVPTITIAGLSAAKRRALVIADNKLGLEARWNETILAEELKFLSDPEIDLGSDTGFDTVEIDTIIDDPGTGDDTRADATLQAAAGPPVTRPGDVWELGTHRVVCGNATDPAANALVMAGELARMVITDPPYNVPIGGHVSGLGQVRHREFVEGSGEMTSEQFTGFLTQALNCTKSATVDGGILFCFMDWRHQSELLAAGRNAGLEQKNLIVWDKTNAGMGTFYRSQHELVFVFKTGRQPHLNNFGLGGSGRYRTNVWTYPGVNTFRRGRQAELALHPTVKPVALVADAIKDVSNRGDIVLDPFGGSGTTLIAAEKTGRRARLIELDPLYVDVIVRRWQAFTGGEGRHFEAQKSFAQISVERN